MRQLSLTLLSLVLASSAYPLGIRVDDKDALATARGNAFTATADNASAVYYNPAGITQIAGSSISAGVYALDFKADYRNSSGQKFSTDNDPQFVPFIHFTTPIPDSPLTFGFSTHVPFGLKNDWPENTSFSTLTTRSNFRSIRFTPVLAWKVNPALSLAFGPAFNDGRADLRRVDPWMGQIRLKGSDQALGYVFGAHYRHSEKHVFGVTYRSRTTFNLEGHMSFGPTRVPAEADFSFPDVIVAGYSYRPTPDWNLEFNLDWTQWALLNDVTVKTVTGDEIVMPFHWKSSLIYKFGVTRYLHEKYRISAGCMFSENSVPSKHFSPSVPDSDRHLISTGFGGTHGKFDWDVAYQFGYSPKRRVSGSEAPPPYTETADGNYRTKVHAVSASLAYHF